VSGSITSPGRQQGEFPRELPLVRMKSLESADLSPHESVTVVDHCHEQVSAGCVNVISVFSVVLTDQELEVVSTSECED